MSGQATSPCVDVCVGTDLSRPAILIAADQPGKAAEVANDLIVALATVESSLPLPKKLFSILQIRVIEFKALLPTESQALVELLKDLSCLSRAQLVIHHVATEVFMDQFMPDQLLQLA